MVLLYGKDKIARYLCCHFYFLVFIFSPQEDTVLLSNLRVRRKEISLTEYAET